ncbi:MAG: hypothetical protein M1133_00455 [Armatimonadetes bacterium]|nr:hypothetical protein [Armatimonadota bacterium]
MSEQAGSGTSVIVTICAVVGALSGLVGSGLGSYNFFKARKKERREEKVKASQCLVRAEYQKVPDRRAKRLCLIAIEPVTELVAQFDKGDVYTYECLGPEQSIVVKEFDARFGEKRYFTAKIKYKDSGGREHNDENVNISGP